MKQLRAAAEKEPELVDAVLDSMSRVKIVISDVIWRPNLKGKYHRTSNNLYKITILAVRID